MKQRLPVSSNWIRVAVCAVLTLAALAAQAPPAQLNIVVLEGEGAINNVRQRTVREPIVRVEDENHRPVAGAAVVFTLPTEGASGEFAGGAKNLTVLTDEQGRAVAHGLKTNRVAGKLQIHVNASYRGQSARTTITQFNMEVPGAKAGGGSGKIIAILAIAGAAAAGGVVAGTRGKSSAPGAVSPPPMPAAGPIVLTPGSGTVGPPR